MNKKVLIYGLLVIFASMTTVAAAEEVYVTATGSKYHKSSCRLIRNKETAKAMDKDEALASNHQPCKVCFKDDLVESDSDDQEKITKSEAATKSKK